MAGAEQEGLLGGVVGGVEVVVQVPGRGQHQLPGARRAHLALHQRVNIHRVSQRVQPHQLLQQVLTTII